MLGSIMSRVGRVVFDTGILVAAVVIVAVLPNLKHYMVSGKPDKMRDKLLKTKTPSSLRGVYVRPSLVNIIRTQMVKPNVTVASDKGQHSSLGERIVSESLESMFRGRSFEKARPSWLVNPYTQNRLELDCYNSDIGLACEYNGVQHYKMVPRFHETYEDFRSQVFRDFIKRKTCHDHKVTLLEVPYTIPPDKIPMYLYDTLKKIAS